MWVNVSSSSPCPICGSTKWCATDGHKVCCRKHLDNPKVDSNGSPYSIYDVDDELPSQPPVNRSKVSIANCISAYPLLLQFCPLIPRHRRHLLERGLSREWIEEAQYASLQNNRLNLAATIAKKVDVSGVPGFVDDEGWKVVGPTGLLIPVRDPAGRVVAIKIRPDDATVGKYVWLSSRRYNGLSPGNQPHFPNRPIPSIIRITEGELKADVATHRGNLYTVSIPGISSYKPLLNLLPQLSVTGIVLAPDSDFRTNPHVQRSLRLLADSLTEYRLWLQTWPEQYKGIDDALLEMRDRETTATPVHPPISSLLSA